MRQGGAGDLVTNTSTSVAPESGACHIHFRRLKKAIMNAAIPIMITHSAG